MTVADLLSDAYVAPESAISDAALGTSRGCTDEDCWREISEQLIAWREDAGPVDDELGRATREVLRNGEEIVHILRESGDPPPMRVVTTGDGGIAFEWMDDHSYDSLEVKADGTIHRTSIKQGRLLLCERVN